MKQQLSLDLLLYFLAIFDMSFASFSNLLGQKINLIFFIWAQKGNFKLTFSQKHSVLKVPQIFIHIISYKGRKSIEW